MDRVEFSAAFRLFRLAEEGVRNIDAACAALASVRCAVQGILHERTWMTLQSEAAQALRFLAMQGIRGLESSAAAMTEAKMTLQRLAAEGLLRQSHIASAIPPDLDPNQETTNQENQETE